MRSRRIPAYLATAALVLAGCTGGDGESAGPTALAELGDGEGELNLVIWTGYAEDGTNDPDYDWVTPFEEETGCQVNTQDGTDSANRV
jgi:putative spermidine/putrescine transport system substrate-binding protein